MREKISIFFTAEKIIVIRDDELSRHRLVRISKAQIRKKEKDHFSQQSRKRANGVG